MFKENKKSDDQKESINNSLSFIENITNKESFNNDNNFFNN